jgi:RNA polymerase-associated protein RTF1
MLLRSFCKQISTNKLLVLKFGNNEKEFPMYLISDSRPSQDDINKYMTVVKSSRQQVISKRQAAKLRRKRDELVTTYTYTKEDIDRALEERKSSGITVANLSLEQTRVDLAVQSARSAVDEAQARLEESQKILLEHEGSDREASSLERDIEMARKELEKRKRDLVDRLSDQQKVHDVAIKRRKTLNSRTNDRNWAKVNQRNKELNEIADFEAFKEQKARESTEAKSGGLPKFNPYARRKVKPKMLWEVGQKEEKKDDDPKEPHLEIEPENASLDKTKQQKSNMLKAAQAVKEAEKAAQSHQFNLDEEVTFDENGFGLNSRRITQSRVRKGLSLIEYQTRKTAGTL